MISASGDGLIRSTCLPPIFYGPGDEERLTAAGVIFPGVGSVDEHRLPAIGPSVCTYAYLEWLPAAPDALYLLFRAQAQGKGQSLEQEMLTLVADALRYSVAPPATRAALYEVATRIDGVEIVDASADDAGRAGTSVAVIATGVRLELIFDPETGDMLGSREVMVAAQDGLEVGDVISSDSTVVTIVDAIPAG